MLSRLDLCHVYNPNYLIVNRLFDLPIRLLGYPRDVGQSSLAFYHNFVPYSSIAQTETLILIMAVFEPTFFGH